MQKPSTDQSSEWAEKIPNCLAAYVTSSLPYLNSGMWREVIRKGQPRSSELLWPRSHTPPRIRHIAPEKTPPERRWRLRTSVRFSPSGIFVSEHGVCLLMESIVLADDHPTVIGLSQ